MVLALSMAPYPTWLLVWTSFWEIQPSVLLVQSWEYQAPQLWEFRNRLVLVHGLIEFEGYDPNSITKTLYVLRKSTPQSLSTDILKIYTLAY
jgi:hypothetical protein